MTRFDDAFFDAGIDRTGTDCIKWDRSRATNGANILPMFIADMDFPCAPAIQQALMARAAHPCYGYTASTDADKDAFLGFWQRRHGLTLSREDVLTIPGVVPGLKLAVHALTAPGDGVIIQSPVYGPFRMSVEATGRRVMDAPMRRREDGGYDMDLAAVEAQCRAGAKLFINCNPHNPASRAWTREELAALLAVLDRYGVPLVSDEIHADFVYAPKAFVPTLSVRREGVVMLCAAGKSFNVAGLKLGTAVICDAAIRERFRQAMAMCGVEEGSLLSMTAMRAAYTQCDDWLDGLRRYLDGNRAALQAAIAREVPRAVLTPIEATYLGWLDLRAYGYHDEELMARTIAAGVQFNAGRFFGDAGDGFLRINFGCPRRNIDEAARRLAAALE